MPTSLPAPSVPRTHERLLSPLDLGPFTVRNRIVMGSMHVGLEDRRADVKKLAAFLGERFTAGVQASLDAFDLPWSVSRLGARAEYRFARPAPRTGAESAAAADDELDAYLHLALANREILMTPFHNMALMCPDTSEADVDLHTEVFREVTGALR